MSRFLLIIVVILSVMASTPSAQAYDESYRANPKYDFMVREASRYQGDNFRFGLFRGYYKDTRQYDPIADDIVDEMFGYSYVAQTETDPEKVEKAMQAYQKLVLEHLANLRVVAQASSLSKLDPRFGNADFFKWVMRGLIADINNSGDGKKLQSAYHIITLSEETVLLGQLGVKPIGVKAANEGYYHYNMHEVEDLKTGQKSTVFVNTTIPMRFLEKQRKSAGVTLAIPRQ